MIAFCIENKEECHTILNILKQYDLVSGQHINFSKSSIQFGYKVDDTIQAELKHILGILNLRRMGTYLGIPESRRGANTKKISSVRDRLHNRIKGWTSKILSKGRKEVIKSVSAMLPTYVMSCFRLPKSLTTTLTSAVVRLVYKKSLH